MAGRPKQGIDYSGWSVDIFDSDTKIDKLLDSKGWPGFGIYFYLCQRAYKANGYFFEWSYDDCATTARKMGGGINSGTVRETVSYCLQIDLFNKRLFDRWGVLTSRGIQRRYWAVLSERRSKIVYEEYWLLKDVECKGLVKISLKSDVKPTNTNDTPANADVQSIKESKVKKSKGKENKEKETGETGASPDAFSNPELEDAFQTFLTCRRQNGQRLVEKQISILRQELMRLGKDDRERLEIANKSIANGWKSFYTIKKPSRETDGKKGNSNNYPHRDYNYDAIRASMFDQ
ncbi:MAG: DUF4373 domain-containing protein [Lachnospiraceae bacterium]|nr:DUF4373 domain-containing protein [Lachnospiraceae bacterium]